MAGYDVYKECQNCHSKNIVFESELSGCGKFLTILLCLLLLWPFCLIPMCCMLDMYAVCPECSHKTKIRDKDKQDAIIKDPLKQERKKALKKENMRSSLANFNQHGGTKENWKAMTGQGWN